jgi:hypothetical protein
VTTVKMQDVMNVAQSALSDLELSKMTMRDLGPQALVSRNILHRQHHLLMRGLGDMSSDGQTQQGQYGPKNFQGI